MKKRMSLLLLILLSLVQMLCTNRNQSSVIRLVYSNKVNYEPFIIAHALGYFKEVGLNVQVKLVAGGIDAAEALITGSADAGAMGDAPAVILTSRHSLVKIVARYGKGEKIHRLLAVNDIQIPEDLIGKRLGVHAGSSTHGGFLLWADSKGLKVNEMQIVPMNPLDIPAAIQTQQIDAMAGSEPWPTHVENLCGNSVHELDDFRGLGNCFPHVFVVTKRLADDSPEAVCKLIQVMKKAVAYLVEHPDKASEITSSSIGLSLQDQKRCTNRLIWNVGWDITDLESMKITAEYMRRFGKIEQIPDLNHFIDIRYF